MSKILIQSLLLIVFSVHHDCEVYYDRPKIKTIDGNLYIEPATGKSIYLLSNGPKSGVFVGEVNLLDFVTSAASSGGQHQSESNDLDTYQNVPSSIISRLEKLESQQPLDTLYSNITLLSKRINRLTTKVNKLQSQLTGATGKDECQSRPCRNGGTCLNLVNGYHCLCPSTWEGTNCDVDVNECRNFAGTDLGCQNGATCLNRPGSYECSCRTGWYGLHCTRRAKDCLGGNFEMCGHGTCVPTTSGEGITCICNQGWTTNGTGVACLTDVNECDSSQGPRCSVNPLVECINLPGTFRCGQCPHGFEGDGYICSDINECLTIPNGGCSTSPMVTCHNTIGSRICGECPPGYQGDGITCSWRGSCNINRGGCHPSAQCVDNPALGGQIAQCICPIGMEGDGIGIHGCYVTTSANTTNRCENNPCGAHGQCHPLRTGYTCICYRGYGGAHCSESVNYCQNNPCLNGGSCRPDGSLTRGFRCECTAQYSGDLCHVASKMCGGLLLAEEGSIVYPLTNNTNYDHNARCAWVIQTNRDKVINVTFSKFNLELQPSCLYDFLQIHDGRSSASQLIGRFCGTDYPKGGNIISSHNNLYFWFRSDQTIAKGGFALHWTSINPVCGGEVDASSHGHISSPGSPGKYPPNRDCYWHLTTTLGKRIELHFFALDIEEHANCSFDYIAIYDGERTTDPLLSRFCNSTQPAPVISAGPEIMIHFHSDAYGSGNGFQLVYTPKETVPGCGGYFTEEKGEIINPSYDNKYMHNLLCEYKIQTSPDTQIRINFKSFKLESSFGCKYDYLKIYDGPSTDSRLVGKFCGIIYPKSYTSSSNKLFIKFKTDSSGSADGFKIAYESVCQKTILGESGVIKSPGYPFSYPENRVCEYIVGTTPGKSIQLTFQDFDIEDSNFYKCQYDNVEIRDGVNVNATSLGKYCGGIERIPSVITSTHNYLFIRFKSDLSNTGTGFYANYTSLNVECGGIYRETSGLINFPSGNKEMYGNDMNCTWMIIAPPGMHIKLLWSRFDVEARPSCISDYVEIIEVDDNNENNVLGKYCGDKIPPLLIATTNKLMIKFESDSSVKSTGFSVSYSFIDERNHCSGTFTKTHGVIFSPGWPRPYENRRDCTWTIRAPAGQQIKLNITQFDLERPIRDKCDYGDFLEIKNGNSQASALIGKFCGSFQQKTIVSVANTLFLHFRSDAYITGKGFKIEWDSTVTGCGGTMTGSRGSISSPNYPENFNENAECFYRIVTSAGSRIQITFTDIDLPRTLDCKYYYVEIFDGRSVDAPSLGKRCFITPGSTRIETSSNYAYVKYRSEGGKGFLLTYNTICQNNVTGMHGVIESPEYPNKYPLNLKCLWTINVPKGNKINITFTNFDIFKRYRPWALTRNNSPFVTSSNLSYLQTVCSLDYLEMKQSSQTNFGSKFCGSSLPPKVTTDSNSIQIRFVTNGYFPRNGFRLEWARFGCGGYIQKRYGSVSVDKSLTLGREIECEWTIEAPPGTSVTFTVMDIYMIDSPNCTIDAIEIYNGQSVRDPQISKICHKGATKIRSSGNFMLIRFVKTSQLRDVSFTGVFDSFATGCGGRIESRTGIIHSMNYPKNYLINMDCLWIIAVPSNHRIELNFMDFDLYTNSNDDTDCGDHIKLYDGEYVLNKNYTTRICPKTNVNKGFTSKKNMLGLKFISDVSGTAKGFKANFTITCGATIKALMEGIITSEKFVSHSNKNCTWTILAPSPNQQISLTITHMSIPKNKDIVTNRNCPSSYLRVFDGDDDEAPLVDEYCGRKVPPMIVSHGSAITIQLGTYSGLVAGEFSAHYTPLTSACGGSLTSEEGTIASPNYPLSYPVSADCEWILNTSPGNRVYITFERFGLEYSENCNEDYLEIRENDGAGALLGVYCGTDIPTNTTTGTKLYIKFHSDNKNAGRGFLLHYGFLHGNQISGQDQGQVTSPLFPFKYEGAGEYSWRINVADKDTISVYVDSLEIPTHGTTCYNSLTIYDGYDDEASVMDVFCGLLGEPKMKTTSSNIVYIKLKLDETNTGTLFHINWARSSKVSSTVGVKTKINCGGNGTKLISPGEAVTFSSPNYPSFYANDLNCEWVFQSTNANHLSIKFNDIKLEQTPNCFADSISIYSTDILPRWTPLNETVCLSELTKEDVNSGHYMKVKFRTDSSVGEKGFQAQVRSVCGGLVSGLSGVVGPTWTDNQNAKKYIETCEWTVKVRPGRVIKFRFEHFNITSSSDGCSTYIVLRNGNSAEAPLLSSGKYCGLPHENRGEIETSSNALFISYTYISIRGFQNFKIRYEEKSIECGVTSKLDNVHTWEVINSPNYPAVPAPYTECEWTFTGPPGEVLRVDFIDRFDLDISTDCNTEFVEVHDGTSDMSPLKGRFCLDKPSTIKTTGNTVYIKYSTQLAEPRNGFKANVSIDVCGGRIVAAKGEVTSPGYPHMVPLPYGSVCEWRIIGWTRNVFKIKAEDINLPVSEIQCETKITIEETVSVNNTVTILKTICDSDIDDVADIAPIESSTNEVIIKLHIGKPSQWTDGTENRGFRFTFNSSRPQCGGYITTSEGFLTTPGYPRESQLRYCQWLISVPDKSRRVRLEILDSDTSKHKIGMYSDLRFQTLLKILQSTDTTTDTLVFESSGSTMAVYLFLNPLETQHRFKAKFSSDEEALCGGSLSGSSGEVLSPTLNRSYSCDWHYNSDMTNSSQFKTLYVAVKVNSSVSRTACRFSDSKLIIKSVLNSETFSRFGGLNFMKSLCGNTDTSFRIPSGVMDIKANKKKDASFYFHLEWNMQPCGGDVQVGENSINIINVPNPYNETLECVWIVRSPTEGRIQITLEGEFLLDCANEYIKIGQSVDETYPPIVDYCKDKTQESPVITRYKYVYVQYHSAIKNKTNVRLSVKTVTSQCGGYLTQNDNVFSSPNYPKVYASNQECVWEINADLGSRISLQFIDRFVVEDRVNCTKDAVIIYDWKDNAYTEIAKLCGRKLPPVFNSTSNQMKVVLRTDADINMDGFQVQWVPICGAILLASEKEQFLYSPGYPDSYRSNLDCSYEILAAGQKISMKFFEFSLEGAYPTCENDNLTIIGMNSDSDYIQATYCALQIPPPMNFREQISIKFKTDEYSESKGFKLSYKTYSCGGKVNESTVLSSGNLNNNYEHNLNCTWLVEAPTNKVVVFKFQFIDLESLGSCFNDYLAVYNGLTIDDDKRLGLICGHLNSTTVLRSSGNTAVLQFVTDASLSFKGFKVEVFFTYSERAGCGGTIDLTSTTPHTLTSPLIGKNMVYEPFLDCHWNIRAPEDYVIKIEFKSFHVAPCEGVNQTALGLTKCDCDVVEIKDGLNPNSLVIDTFCGHTTPPQLISSRNLMSVRLFTDGEISSGGFEALLSTQLSTCGRSVFKVGNKVQRIRSPGYATGSIARGLHCVYHFDSSEQPYRSIQVTVKNLDLEPGTPTECNKDRLIISSSLSIRNETIGKDFVINPQTSSLFFHRNIFEESSGALNRIVLCGNKHATDYYFTDTVTINLITSPDTVTSTHKGVEIEVSYIPSCGRNYTEPHGRIVTAMILPGTDTSQNDCYTLITAAENKTISLYFIYTSLNYWAQTSAKIDVYDGDKTSSTKLITLATDSDANKALHSSGRYMLIRNQFLDGDRVTFDANYLTTDKGRGCGGNYQNVYGRVSSPFYPEVYRQKNVCSWELETPMKTRLILRFSVFDLGRSCDQNYVQLVDRSGAVVSTYCSETPADYTSNDNYVKIVFTTTMNNGGTGWLADFTATL